MSGPGGTGGAYEWSWGGQGGLMSGPRGGEGLMSGPREGGGLTSGPGGVGWESYEWSHGGLTSGPSP